VGDGFENGAGGWEKGPAASSSLLGLGLCVRIELLRDRHESATSRFSFHNSAKKRHGEPLRTHWAA
jgi:hypothetical protein